MFSGQACTVSQHVLAFSWKPEWFSHDMFGIWCLPYCGSKHGSYFNKKTAACIDTSQLPGSWAWVIAPVFIFSCSSCVSVGFLHILQLSPISQKYAGLPVSHFLYHLSIAGNREAVANPSYLWGQVRVHPGPRCQSIPELSWIGDF